MKRSSILIGLFIFCLGMSSGRASQAAPQLEVVGGASFDFGSAQPNQTLTHEFVFRNHGDSALKIEQVKGG